MSCECGAYKPGQGGIIYGNVSPINAEKLKERMKKEIVIGDQMLWDIQG